MFIFRCLHAKWQFNYAQGLNLKLTFRMLLASSDFNISNSWADNAYTAQEVEKVIHQSECRWFNPLQLRLHVEVSLGKKLNLKFLPMAVPSVWIVIAPDEQGAPCMVVWANGWILTCVVKRSINAIYRSIYLIWHTKESLPSLQLFLSLSVVTPGLPTLKHWPWISRNRHFSHTVTPHVHFIMPWKTMTLSYMDLMDSLTEFR